MTLKYGKEDFIQGGVGEGRITAGVRISGMEFFSREDTGEGEGG